LVPYDPQENSRLLVSVFRALRDAGELDEPFPEAVIQEMAAYPESCGCRKSASKNEYSAPLETGKFPIRTWRP